MKVDEPFADSPVGRILGAAFQAQLHVHQQCQPSSPAHRSKAAVLVEAQSLTRPSSVRAEKENTRKSNL
jgi:hypothetical protein